MVIDKKLDLDKELEYFPDGSVSFAQNVVVSDDGLTIQNEPAIVNFLAEREFDLVGFVACNEEFVLFSSKNDIVRVGKDTSWRNCDTNWKWQGGIVFGTFSYNINNELIIAISERNPKSDCPLKVINLDRDYVEGYDKDDIYTLTPNIPKSNMINVDYVQGNRIRKGKYNFFIKYFIEDFFETAWFPIGIPVFAYDNSKADKVKTINSQNVTAEKIDGEKITEYQQYVINYGDFYNEDNEYTNDNIKLTFDINDSFPYTHYKIGFINNHNSGTEGGETYKININNKIVIINDSTNPVSVDELTVGIFNINNVNTLCSYKDRLYLANYKEENRNKILEKGNIDTSGIKVFYNYNEKTNNYVNYDKNTESYTTNTLKDQWKPVPGRGAVYNFFIHYVYPNGNYTDGIPISNISNFEEIIEYGTYKEITVNVPLKFTYTANSNTTCGDIYNAIQDSRNLFINSPNYIIVINETLEAFCLNNKNAKWFDVKHDWLEQNSPRIVTELDLNYLIELSSYYNSKGDVLYETPTDSSFDVSKLYFTGIKMYPEFVGYFISYEKPEYIQVGEGFITCDKGYDSSYPDLPLDLNLAPSNAYNKFKFYYPEFNIVGGSIKVDKLKHVANPSNAYFLYKEKAGFYDHKVQCYNGRIFGSKELANTYQNIKVNNVTVVAPDSFENLGKEGYLKLDTDSVKLTNNFPIYLALSDDKNLYLTRTKKLISLGYIKYINYENENNTYTYGEENVIYNYDFYNCFSSIYYFNRIGIIISETDDNPIFANTTIAGEGTVIEPEYYPSKLKTNADGTTSGIYPHINIIQYWNQSHYPLFLKEINQDPTTIFYSDNIISKYYPDGGSSYFKIDKAVSKPNKIISPKYVNDLYKLHPNYYDYTGKLIVNYDESLYQNNIEQYNKTIRRSDVLQSESVKTAWRYFRPENYKVITEDKGDIKNVVGIGNYLFAHCEHSLFLFDITDSLQALDKNVQLFQPDSFEVNYKEVFTADKGYGGLQDYVSWICDEFGYIFFDKSAQKIYRFDGGQLKDMSDGINNLIKGISAQSIFFGNDRPRNRILANLRGTDDNVIISYNLLSNGWISTHSYVSNYNFIGLKDKVFLLNVKGSNLTINHYLETEFNKYSLPVGNIDNDGSFKSFVDVVFTNSSYNKIKVLDFITYIINKEPADNFELLQIEIFTNCCYSGVIDISQERKKVSEYKKPYYDFERWNFNYFRNVIDKIENGDIVDRISGRIHSYPQKVQRGYDNALMSGKYVVIRFSFKLMSKQVNVKDVQAYFKP